MTGRERLEELVHDAIWEYDELTEECRKEDAFMLTDDFTYIADFLHSNGVIAPPVKCGQTVWCLRLKDEIAECRVYSVEITVYSAPETWFAVEYEDDYGEIHCDHWKESVIGKTVFLTREEAEAALAERMKPV